MSPNPGRPNNGPYRPAVRQGVGAPAHQQPQGGIPNAAVQRGVPYGFAGGELQNSSAGRDAQPFSETFQPLLDVDGANVRSRVKALSKEARVRSESAVWHHGANACQESLASGEMRCTLTALSPLFVGNQQVPVREMAPQLQRSLYDGATSVLRETVRLEPALDPRKAVGFPFILPDGNEGVPGPVLLAGESLKGMMRQLMGSLMSAPLERVNPGSFSYRPNANVSAGQESKSRPLAAEVATWNKDELLLELFVIGNIAELMFVHGNDNCLSDAAVEGEHGPMIPAQTRVHGMALVMNRGRNGLEARPGAHFDTGNKAYRWLRYHFGLDVDQNLHRLHRSRLNLRGAGTAHPSVLVPLSGIDYGAKITVDPAVVRAYLDTQTHVCSDSGHLANHPLVDDVKTARGIKPVPELSRGDLIFCEVLANPNPNACRVISFGHNFRYRWRQLDTVCDVAVGFDADARQWVHRRRPELSALSSEAPIDDRNASAPARLSAIRRLLGFVTDEGNPALGGLNRLADPFNHLAGRVSINWAMERIPEGKAAPEYRFVHSADDRLPPWTVLLHPLGLPKPSFGSNYVPQPATGNGLACTSWGAGIIPTSMRREDKSSQKAMYLQSSTLNFAWRKHYLHQFAESGSDGSSWTIPREHFCLTSLIGRVRDRTAFDRSGYAETWPTLLTNNQAGFVRFVTRPGVTFGFSVRFRDLDSVETGALAACLDPNRFASWCKSAQGLDPVRFPTTRHLLNQRPSTALPCFGQKLGRARALGMGSVHITIDSLVSHSATEADSNEWKSKLDASFAALTAHLSDSVLRNWFDVLTLVRSSPPKPYMVSEHQTRKPTVKWCGERRQSEMSELRRSPLGRP